MSDILIEVEAGKSRRLNTAGKLCESDILVVSKAVSSGDSYYDTFWDAYQNYGNRKNYERAFTARAGTTAGNEPCWTMASFKPKYDLKPINANYMFQMFKMYENNGTDHNDVMIWDFDLEAHLAQCGVSLDLSECPILSAVFSSSYIGTLPVIDASSATGNGMSITFGDCSYLKTIRKIIVSRNLTQYNLTFKNCSRLENVIFEGEIAASISFNNSPLLTNESVQSIIDCLVDMTGATALTLTLHADVKAKLTEEQITAITSKNWTLA